VFVRNIGRLHAGSGLEELRGDHAGVAGRAVEALVWFRFRRATSSAIDLTGDEASTRITNDTEAIVVTAVNLSSSRRAGS